MKRGGSVPRAELMQRYAAAIRGRRASFARHRESYRPAARVKEQSLGGTFRPDASAGALGFAASEAIIRAPLFLCHLAPRGNNRRTILAPRATDTVFPLFFPSSSSAPRF